jgi:hypothetical protein
MLDQNSLIRASFVQVTRTGDGNEAKFEILSGDATKQLIAAM